MAVAVPLVVLGVALWYVVAPPQSGDGYLERAGATAKSIRSQVQTAHIWAQTLAEGDTTAPAALVGFEETERDAASAASQFERWKPPEEALSIRGELTALAAEAEQALSDLRIAAQLEQWDRVDELARPLPALARRLELFQHEVER